MAAHAAASETVASRMRRCSASMRTIVADTTPIVAGVTDPLTARLAATVRDARTAKGMSVAALAEASGVSRAMIGKIERGEVQPTAALLGRLSAALGSTLSELI